MMAASNLEHRFNALLKEGLPRAEEESGIRQYHPRAAGDVRATNPDREASYADSSTRVAYAFKGSLSAPASTEGLYRTVDSLLLSCVRWDAQVDILDLGCGTGRTIYDCAPLLSRAMFVGMDRSVSMCKRAKQVLLDGQPIPLPGLENQGLPNVVFRHARTLTNVVIVQGSALDLPFRAEAFDAVASTMMVDRVGDPARAIVEMVRVTKPGGSLIIATPLNLAGAERWSRFGDLEKLACFVAGAGTQVQERFDGLVYREVIDAHGNFSEWCVSVVLASKTVGDSDANGHGSSASTPGPRGERAEE